MVHEYQKLRFFNLCMGLLHAYQGALIIFLSNTFTLPVSTTFLIYNPVTARLDSTMSYLFDVRLGYAVAAFLFISAIFHLFIASEYFDAYTWDLAKHMNKVRWIEYAISASLMMVLIGMLAGVYDIGTLVLMFGATAVMNLCGLVMEEVNHSRKQVNWIPFLVGSLSGILPWLVILIYFLGAAADGAGATPTFVYWIYGSIFVFFNCFAVNMYLQYKQIGPWRDYLYGERVYIILSLIAKSALAWQIFAGTLRPM